MNFDIEEESLQMKISNIMSLLKESENRAGNEKIEIINRAEEEIIQTETAINELKSSVSLFAPNDIDSALEKVKQIEKKLSDLKSRAHLLKLRHSVVPIPASAPNLQDVELDSISIENLKKSSEIGVSTLVSLLESHQLLERSSDNISYMKMAVTETETQVSLLDKINTITKKVLLVVIALEIICIIILLFF